MEKFLLSTDSTCDLYHDYIVENRIARVPLTFTVEKKGSMEDRLDDFHSYAEYVSFYNELRAGAFSRTAMLNYSAHYNHFLKLAEGGAEEVVHVTISSGLSPTKDVAAQAAADVKKLYPKFNVTVLDPLTATVGQGCIVMLALKCRNEGKTAEETRDYCYSKRLHIQHFIVPNNLAYLRKGGRISAAAAAFGNLLDIKPIISFDKEGRLFPLAKVKGVRKAVSFIKAKMEKEGPDELGMVYVVHTDNMPIANELVEYVRARFGIDPFLHIMGPVIGSHVGPDAFALGYISKSERNEF